MSTPTTQLFDDYTVLATMWAREGLGLGFHDQIYISPEEPAFPHLVARKIEIWKADGERNRWIINIQKSLLHRRYLTAKSLHKNAPKMVYGEYIAITDKYSNTFRIPAEFCQREEPYGGIEDFKVGGFAYYVTGGFDTLSVAFVEILEEAKDGMFLLKTRDIMLQGTRPFQGKLPETFHSSTRQLIPSVV